MKIRPIGNNVLLSRVAPKEKTDGGLFIPDSAKEKPLECVVVATGPGEYNSTSAAMVPTGVKSGDRVLIEKWARAEEVDVGGEKLIFAKASQIVAVLEG